MGRKIKGIEENSTDFGRSKVEQSMNENSGFSTVNLSCNFLKFKEQKKIHFKVGIPKLLEKNLLLKKK